MLFGSNGQVSNDHVSEEFTTEAASLIMEAAILENTTPEELQAFLENHTEVDAALRDEVLLEKTIVRLDKQAKINHAQQTAIFTIAREKNDPKMKKLMTVWRMERFLEADLFKKYGNEALRRAKKAVQARGTKSKSSLVKTVSNRVNKQFNTPAKKK